MPLTKEEIKELKKAVQQLEKKLKKDVRGVFAELERGAVKSAGRGEIADMRALMRVMQEALDEPGSSAAGSVGRDAASREADEVPATQVLMRLMREALDEPGSSAERSAGRDAASREADEVPVAQASMRRRAFVEPESSVARVVQPGGASREVCEIPETQPMLIELQKFFDTKVFPVPTTLDRNYRFTRWNALRQQPVTPWYRRILTSKSEPNKDIAASRKTYHETSHEGLLEMLRNQNAQIRIILFKGMLMLARRYKEEDFEKDDGDIAYFKTKEKTIAVKVIAQNLAEDNGLSKLINTAVQHMGASPRSREVLCSASPLEIRALLREEEKVGSIIINIESRDTSLTWGECVTDGLFASAECFSIKAVLSSQLFARYLGAMRPDAKYVTLQTEPNDTSDITPEIAAAIFDVLTVDGRGITFSMRRVLEEHNIAYKKLHEEEGEPLLSLTAASQCEQELSTAFNTLFNAAGRDHDCLYYCSVFLANIISGGNFKTYTEAARELVTQIEKLPDTFTASRFLAARAPHPFKAAFIAAQKLMERQYSSVGEDAKPEWWKAVKKVASHFQELVHNSLRQVAFKGTAYEPAPAPGGPA